MLGTKELLIRQWRAAQTRAMPKKKKTTTPAIEDSFLPSSPIVSPQIILADINFVLCL
ncbi:MAG: hypothetical protein HC908_16150 [Calothrix sp. SM1_7_51]|nr:hypothetical protein [Calothrix sp. SM1_7_51]